MSDNEAELIETDKLFRGLAWEGAERRWAWGAGYILATAEELAKNPSQEDQLNRLPWHDVANEFSEKIKRGEIALVGDRGLLSRIGNDDSAAASFALEYQPPEGGPKKDLVVCVVSQKARELSTVPGGNDTGDALRAISDAVHTWTHTPEDRRITAQDIPDWYFRENGVVALEVD